ncbi:MAG: molybdopterin-binding protein [Acidobacteriota bacterium]
MAHDTPRTAAALVIGNELLSGKIRDANVSVLARELFALGITLRRVVICTDEVDTIADELRALRSAHDLVFTSGGVGPTHDDVTVDAVAQALDREVVRAPRLEELLRRYFGERLTEGHLRMADVPAGTELVVGTDSEWPAVRVENVFILPGLPEIFRLKMPILREHLAGDRPFVSRSVDTASDEGRLAPLLDRLVARYPDVAIGSYPRFGADGPRVRITFDGRDSDRVAEAAAAFADELPADQLVGARP